MQTSSSEPESASLARPGKFEGRETGHEQQNILCECLLATAARHVTRPGAEAVTHSQHRRSDVSFCTKLEI